MSLLFRTSIIPLAIHLILWWLLYLVAIVRVTVSAYDASTVSLAYWSWLWLAALLTVFINFIISFRKDFEFQMMMSVPRQSFARRYFQMAVVFNLLVTLLIVLDLNILRYLNHAYGFQEIDFLSFIYGTQANHLIPQLLVVFSILLLFSALGAFIGSSTYRFGLSFIWGFWLTVGLGITILLILSEPLGYFQQMLDALLWLPGGGMYGGPFTGSGHFLIVTLVLVSFVYLNIKKLQLK